MYEHTTPIEHEPTETEELSAEERRVLDWRFDQLSTLGLSSVEARLAAECGVDVGMLRGLVAKGCAPALALRIAL